MTDLDATRPGARSEPPKLVKLAPWLAGLVLLAGLVTFAIHQWPSRNASLTPPPPPASTTPVQRPASTKKVVLPAAARAVAGRFILTAVRREHLAEAWKLASPGMRAGVTYADWLHGAIPVVPYGAPIGVAPLHVVSSHPTTALLEVALFPKAGSKVKPQDFFLSLVKLGKGRDARWYVDSWVPRAAPAVPLRTAG